MNKKYILTVAALFCVYLVQAQVDSSPTTVTDSLLNNANQHHKTANEVIKNKYAKYDLSKRAIDHFMFQFGFYGWGGETGRSAAGGATNDYSLHGFSREFSASFMLDHPFKSNPHYSLGYGIGYNSQNAFMNGKYADIASNTSSLPINGAKTFKKFKMVFTYATIPLELRWSQDIENPSKGLRFALGLRGGLLLQAHSKGKNQLTGLGGQSVNGSGYIEKEYDKRFFNGTKADATFRASLGIFTVYGTYQLTPLLKNNAGPTINPYSFGIGLSLM